MKRQLLGLFLLIALFSSSLQNPEDDIPISYEEFRDVVFSASKNPKSSDLLDAMKFGPIREAFSNPEASVNRETYARIVVAMLTQTDSLPTEEAMQKKLAEDAPLEGTNTNQELYIDWYIHRAANTFAQSKPEETLTFKDVYNDIFQGGISQFFAMLQAQEQAGNPGQTDL